MKEGMMKSAIGAAFLMLVTAGVIAAIEPGSFYCNGPRDRQEIALTFDDGPGPYTERVLAVLARYNVKATFFMEGSLAKMRPELARKVADAGHEVGSHLYSHPDFYHYAGTDRESYLRAEMDKSAGAIEAGTGVKPSYLRMPHGYVRDWVKAAAAEKSYVLVNWTAGFDWNRMPSEELAAAYIKNIKPGAIFLMHDGGKNRQRTVEALPLVIEEAQKQGYRFVTAGEMLGRESSALALGEPVKKGKKGREGRK